MEETRTAARGRYALFSALYPPHIGGVESFTFHLAHALAARGNAVTVVTNDTEGMGAGAADEDGVEVVRLPCRPLAGGRLPFPVRDARFRALDARLRAERWDGILVNARFYPHSLHGMRLAREQGIAPVVLDHGSAPLCVGNPAADRVIWAYERAITAWGRARYRPRYFGVSAKSAQWLRAFGITAEGVISNSIDAAAFRASSSGRDFRRGLGIAADQPLIAFVGRLVPEKGVPALIEASRDAGVQGTGAVIALAGAGPLGDAVAQAASSTLRPLGPLPPADVSALLQQADLLCLPTRSEGFSTTLLEAAACGTPAVVTDVGGAAELIPSAGYGTIIPSADAAQVARAIRRLAADRPLLAEQGARVRERVETGFSWDRTAARVEEVLG